VEVTKYRFIDKIYTSGKTLLQVSSEIVGELYDGYQKNLGEIIYNLLPAGSVTGAPKKKTVEIIKEAEKYDRGYYTGLYKLRVIYSDKIEEIEFIPYTLRKIDNVKLIFNDEIDYTYKYLDKNPFNNLLAQKGTCDDIIIVKKGLITDASFANLVFFDGREYHTPSSPLLRGTKREELLDKKVISEKIITPDDLHNYIKAYFINAMIDLFQLGIDINNIWV